MRELERTSGGRIRLCGAGIVLAALAAYANTFSTPFHFDDVPTIQTNPTLRHLGSAWRTPMDGSTTTGRPVLNLAFAANFAAGGLSVVGYHVVNLTIHVLAGLVLFGIARRTLVRFGAGRGEDRPSATLVAFGAALLWTVHPLQTESVTYIAQRAESLMALFYLLALYCFIRGVEGAGLDEAGSRGRRPRLQWFGLSWLACFLGMGTKEVAVSAPVIIFLYDGVFVAGGFLSAWSARRRLYLTYVITWVWLVVLVAAAHGRGGTAGFNVGVSVWTYWPTQAPAIVAYLRLSVLPIRQIFDYGALWVGSLWKVLPDAVIVVALAAASVTALFRRRSAMGFLGVFFFCILAPTSLIPGNRQTMVEHRMYLALAAVTVAGAVGWGAACRRILGERGSGAFIGGILAAALALGVLTFHRNTAYRSDLAIWNDTVAKLPDGPYARNNLGVALFAAGRLDEAAAQYAEAVRLKPDYADAYNNWGNTLMGQGRLEEAVGKIRTALKDDPGYADAYTNLGIALAKEGRYPEALADSEEAVRRNPYDGRYFSNLGKTLAQMGRGDEAIAAYESAVRCEPDDAGFHFGLGNVLDRNGRLDGAMKEYEEALRLRPDYAEAHNNLGGIYARRGRIPEALAQFQEAVRVEPQNPGFRMNLGNGLAQSGRMDEAIEEYRQTLRLDPDYKPAQTMLVRLLSAEPR